VLKIDISQQLNQKNEPSTQKQGVLTTLDLFFYGLGNTFVTQSLL
jgi:hypothetical protein